MGLNRESYVFAVVFFLVISVFLVSIIGNNFVGFVVHPVYKNFSSPESGVSYVVGSGVVSVVDDIVYRTGYYSVDGGPWQSFSLSGSLYGSSSVWLKGSASRTLPVFGMGEHYVIVYSCSYNNGWNCHDNRWQLLIINNTASKGEDSGLSVSIDSPANGASFNTNSVTLSASTIGTGTSTWIDMDRSLVGYWNMDSYSSSGVYDNSSYKNFATIVGEGVRPETTSGVKGQGILFKPQGRDCTGSQWLEAKSLLGTNLFDNTGQITYSVWVKPESMVTDSGIMGIDMIKIHILPDNRIQVSMFNPGLAQYATGKVIALGQWQHLAMTYTKSTGSLSVYRNGNLIGSSTIYNANMTNPGGYFFIGQNWWDCFNGTMDEVMLFNRALTSNEIKSLYDSQTNKLTATVQNLANGQHTYNVYASDLYGNVANAGQRTLSINAPITCSTHEYRDCYNGDVYWYNSCDVREGISVDCTSSQTCMDGQCVSTQTGYCGDDICNNEETCTSCASDCGACSTYSRTFYVSATGNNDADGRSPSTAWQSISKVNSQTFAPGDAILFKRGETFYGTLTVKNSGSSGNPITFGAYGTGEKPIITGFTAVSGWTNEGNGIYSKTISSESNPNIVSVNGKNTPIGRWPNTGWLIVDSHSSFSSITDSALSSSPRDWDGGELVLRAHWWIITRNSITSHSGNTIYYDSISDYYDAMDGNGYFIQNHIGTFNEVGDWAYNDGKLYMYFGSSNPSNYNVRFPSLDQFAYLQDKDYITFDNLHITGYNGNAITLFSSTHTTVNNCLFDFIGGTAVKSPWWQYSDYPVIENNVFEEINNDVISFEGDARYASIQYNRMKNIGMIPGLAGSGDGCSIAIYAIGAGTSIRYNTIENTGYNGIHFGGANTIVSNNFISGACSIKDDGAGIYTYEDEGSGKQVVNNIIINSVGDEESTRLPDEGRAHGIYIDGSDNILISGNSISTVHGAGIFLNTQARNMDVTNNNIYDTFMGGIMIISNMGGRGEITDLYMQNNVFVAKDSDEETVYYVTTSGDSAIRSLGTVDYNYYARPIDDTDTMRTQTYAWNGASVYRTLSGWQSYTGLDSHSKKSPKTVSSASDIRFEYNPSGSSKTISLGGNYIDIKGTAYSGSVTLQPYSSITLIKN